MRYYHTWIISNGETNNTSKSLLKGTSIASFNLAGSIRIVSPAFTNKEIFGKDKTMPVVV